MNTRMTRAHAMRRPEDQVEVNPAGTEAALHLDHPLEGLAGGHRVVHGRVDLVHQLGGAIDRHVPFLEGAQKPPQMESCSGTVPQGVVLAGCPVFVSWVVSLWVH